MKDCYAMGKPLDECMIKKYRQLMGRNCGQWSLRNADIREVLGHIPPSPVEIDRLATGFL